MTEDHGTLYVIADFLFQILVILLLFSGICYISIILKELIKGTLGDD